MGNLNSVEIVIHLHIYVHVCELQKLQVFWFLWILHDPHNFSLQIAQILQFVCFILCSSALFTNKNFSN